MTDLGTTRRRPTLTSSDVGGIYDRVAPSYDRSRELWLDIAGAEAEAAMLTDIAPFLRSGARVLDAGCGTGALSRHMIGTCPEIELTLLDVSSEMLARAADLPGAQLQGSMLDLPLADDSFDLVVSAWVIETVTDPRLAVTELLRVLAPGGRLVYTFCSMPERWVGRMRSWPLRDAVKHGFGGEFLNDAQTPWHDCDSSRRRRFRGGLTSEVVLAKCCTVNADFLPAPPPTARPAA